MIDNYANIESKWKQNWKENSTYKIEIDHSKPKYYVLDMFPYPSGAGLHVGHPLGYIASDIFSRYKRMKGYNVLHPMGFDAFGLPAEEYALQTGIHPAVSTKENMERYREQLGNLGFSFDWSREVYTCDPKYYKWTQWIFTKLYAHYYDQKENRARPIIDLIKIFESEGNGNVHAATTQKDTFDANQWCKWSIKEQEEILMNYRLAYRKKGYVNWCEELGTVLANDQVKDGRSERGGYPVEQKAMMQWYLRITAYADRMLDGLTKIDWSNSLKTIQTNWIGRSEGCSIFFSIKGSDKKIEIFTTRADTIFGATYMVLAPEHQLVNELTTPDQQKNVDTYLSYVRARTEIERMAEKKVTGEFIGAYAINPFTNEEIPIWIGEYVLKDYGTGAIMAVPSDDERDLAFATKFGIKIIDVVDKSDYPGATLKDKVGKIINSGFLNGLEVPDAILAAHSKVEELGIGKAVANYKLRDANFSRQRYWGEPFPVSYDKEGTVQMTELGELPVTLPDTNDFKPGREGKSPLARLTDWIHLPDGSIRETDTMPAVAGSSWYYLRYMDPHNDKALANSEALEYWKSVDLYVGGAEHAVAHLMYARFWHKFLYDLGIVPTDEPFKKLINQGMIQGTIEHILIKKDQDENIFFSADLIPEDQHDQYSMPYVHIDFVEDYTSNKPTFITTEGLVKYCEWRKLHEATFITSNGKINITLDGKQAQVVTTGKPDKFYTYSEVGKMSKSRYNVINPDVIIDHYGTDCFRMYEMFLGPIEQSKPWDTNGIDGISKFLRKYLDMYFTNDQFTLSDESATKEELKILHATIKKVGSDIENFSFNTAISTMMVCVNELRKLQCRKREILEPLIRLIAPFAPFISEELWSLSSGEGSVHHSDFPDFEEQYLVEEVITYPICINGKKRGTEEFDAALCKDDIISKVRSLDYVTKWTEDKPIKKIIVVPGRMVNVVV